MDQTTFALKTAGSDARYHPFTGEGEYFELIDIITEPGQGPQVWVTVLDEKGQFLPGIEVQNYYPNSETGRGEVFPSRFPYTEFNFGIGNKYLTHQVEPPDKIRLYDKPSDEIWCGVPDGVHFRWTMILQRRKASAPPPANGNALARVAAALRHAADELETG